MDFFQHDPLTAVEAKSHAQFLAFGPIAFQAARALVNLGLLAAVEKSRPHGITSEAAAGQTGLTAYGARVLLEAGLGLGLVTCVEDRFRLTRAGHFLLHDEMTRVNFNFVNDVCYQGVFDLEKSVREGQPAGLKVLAGGRRFTRRWRICPNPSAKAGWSLTIFIPMPPSPPRCRWFSSIRRAGCWMSAATPVAGPCAA